MIEDMVIGVVLERHVENAKVDVGGAVPATLPMLAFEGASRKNRPNLHVPQKRVSTGARVRNAHQSLFL